MNLTKSRTVKFVATLAGFALAIAFVVTPVSAATIAELQAQIAALSAQLSALSGTPTTGSYTFNTNLTMGSKGTDVMNLQKVLNSSADTQVAASGVGSSGNETSYFGGLTKAAVMKFQTKHGISPVAGYVGPITRAKLNSMGGGTVVTPPVVTPGLPTGGSLAVAAGTQPANSLAPQSAARLPFTTFSIQAGASDVTVNSVTVQRVGLAEDAAFSGIVLLKSDGTQIGIAKTLNSNSQALVGESYVIKAGTTEVFTVAGNMAADLSSYSGQVAGLQVVAINTSATVTGSLPISGAQHTLNSNLSLGSVTVAASSYDPGSSQSKEIGTTGYKFSGARITAGSSEDVRLFSIRWNQTGSASTQDLANVKVYVDGTAYDTTISADGKYYSANFGAGIIIATGLSKDIYIQGDIVGTGSAGRTIKFDLYKRTDLYLKGETYGYGITPPAGANAVVTCSASQACGNFSTGAPWFQANIVTVSSGSATSIGKATSVAAQNIAVSVPNQVFGGFTTDIKGEPISVQEIVFDIATTGTWSSNGVLTNVTIVDSNGAVVAGPVDQPSNGALTLTFTDTVTFPVGVKTYTVKGTVPTGAPNGGTIILSTTPSSSTYWSTVTGQTTGNTITLTPGAFSMNTMTVKSAALAVSVSSSPAAQSIVSGGQVLFTNYQFDASQSGEDVRFGTLALQLSFTGAEVTQLTSCQLFDGTTALNTGSNVLNPTGATGADKTFTLDSQYTVPKGTVKTLALKCNVSTGTSADDMFKWGIQTAPTATGATSGADFTETFTASLGQPMTVASGSFTASVDSSTPNYATVAAGSTGVKIGVFKFRATNENINLTKVGLVLSTSTPSDLSTVYLYQGSTLLGSVVFTGATTVATSTLNSPLVLTKDTDVLITIKADLGNIGSSETGVEGRLVKIDVQSAEGSGVSSGITRQIGTVTAGVNGVRMFKSFPVISADTLASTGVADGKLMRFKVTADSHGPVGIYSMNFTIATSSFVAGGGVASPKVMVYSDSGYSQPVSGSYGAQTGQLGDTFLVDTGGPTFTASTTGSYVPLQIPAGTTYYFQVEATVSGTQVGTSVTTTMNGDGAYINATAHLGTGVNSSNPLTSTTTGAVADDHNDFIWSGNATTTSGVSQNDWANGYGILGLPSSGFSQTRAN
ncbi:MAG: peptidoglycan-binding protein [Candidatus Paceibacterota bacterium]|jgi:hypothetical protein